MFLSLLSSISYSGELKRIDIESKWYGDVYSVGDKEPGFWGAVKESNEAVELIKSNPKAYSEYKKSRIITYLSFAAVFLYNESLDYNESSNDLLQEQLKALPLVIVSSFLALSYQKKAVNTYNSGVDVSVGLTPKNTSLGFVYRY